MRSKAARRPAGRAAREGAGGANGATPEFEPPRIKWKPERTRCPPGGERRRSPTFLRFATNTARPYCRPASRLRRANEKERPTRTPVVVAGHGAQHRTRAWRTTSCTRPKQPRSTPATSNRRPCQHRRWHRRRTASRATWTQPARLSRAALLRTPGPMRRTRPLVQSRKRYPLLVLPR